LLLVVVHAWRSVVDGHSFSSFSSVGKQRAKRTDTTVSYVGYVRQRQRKKRLGFVISWRPEKLVLNLAARTNVWAINELFQ
jgi:hypothetical protein